MEAADDSSFYSTDKLGSRNTERTIGSLVEKTEAKDGNSCFCEWGIIV
jgi:hypothetical protein